MKFVMLGAALVAMLALPSSVRADASCIVSDSEGRIALIDSPLPGKSGSELAAIALPIVYAWAIDWANTESADWPAFNPGLYLGIW